MNKIVAVVAIPLVIAACETGPSGSQSERPTTTASASSIPALALPADVQIVSPGADVPAQIAAFSGKWGGNWTGGLPSNVVVERVSANGDAAGVYAWGYSPQYGITPGSTRFRGKIQNGMLTWGGNIKFEFTLQPNGTLKGERYNGGSQAGTVVMAKGS